MIVRLAAWGIFPRILMKLNQAI